MKLGKKIVVVERSRHSIEFKESSNFENNEHFYTMHVLNILPAEHGLDKPCFDGAWNYFFA